MNQEKGSMETVIHQRLLGGGFKHFFFVQPLSAEETSELISFRWVETTN